LNKLRTSIRYRIIALFLGALTLTFVLVLSQNYLMLAQNEATLSKEISDNQQILFAKISGSLIERMTYYAYDSDSGKSSIWKLRGSRSPITAVQSGDPRKIEIALESFFEQLRENDTLDTLIVFAPDGQVLKAFTSDKSKVSEYSTLGSKLRQQAFQKQLKSGFVQWHQNAALFVTFPIYANARVLGYVYYGLRFKKLNQIFELDSKSHVFSPSSPASVTDASNAIFQNFQVAFYTDDATTNRHEDNYYSVSKHAASLTPEGEFPIYFAKDITQTVKANLNYLYQLLIGGISALVIGGLTLLVVLRRSLDPLNDAVLSLESLSQGNLDINALPASNDEVGKIARAIDKLGQSLNAFNLLRSEARRNRASQEKEILEQTNKLSSLLPENRRLQMKKTLEEIQLEIARYQKQEYDHGLIVETDLVTTLFSKSFGSLATELEMQYSELESLVQERTAELEKARDKANAASDAKGKFLANMTHELRTPLNAIIGYSEMISEEAEEEDLTWLIDDIKRIKDSAVHQLTLVNDILDHSKIEAGKLDLYIEDFELSQCLKFIKDLTGPLAEKNNNVMTFDLADDLGRMTSDETRLRQVLLNIISNACKFTKNGSITVSVYPCLDMNESTAFSIRDTGVGMSSEQVEKVFEEFTQAEGDTAAKYGGTGLGLTITKRLTEMMGGSIEVTSELGQGTTFTLVLPRRISP